GLPDTRASGCDDAAPSRHSPVSKTRRRGPYRPFEPSPRGDPRRATREEPAPTRVHHVPNDLVEPPYLQADALVLCAPPADGGRRIHRGLPRIGDRLP